MARYKLRYGRRKAPFGSEEALILDAAAINVAGTLAASAKNASATVDAAKQQADSTIKAANKQAEALKQQNKNSKELQQTSQDFTKEQNEENRELQKQIQMNLQMLTGQQNVNDKLERAKIQVKNGGYSKRRILPTLNAESLLRGRSNISFKVTDGGGVTPVTTTPEGFDLYEIKGNDHEHYHKTKSGKSKTGVGIKFEDGNIIEGEGNQNGKQGEYMLTMPNDAVFISRHTLKGFNPARAINNGMHPLQAYNIQENIKDAYDIPDNGKAKCGTSLSRKHKLAGGDSTIFMDNVYAAQATPDFSSDTIAPTSTGVVYAIQNNPEADVNNNNYATTTDRITAKCGGALRHKLACGGYTRGRRQKAANGWNTTDFVNLGGAGLSMLGNGIGTIISNNAANKANSYITAANNQYAAIMSDAYSRMKGIDLSDIKKSDYEAGHAMAALQAPIVSVDPEITGINRSLQRRQTSINQNSLSGAAKLNRLAQAETDAQDQRSKMYYNAAQQKQQVLQGNAERTSQVSQVNAQLDKQANDSWANSYLSGLKYNNDIENTKIEGDALSKATAATQNAQSTAQTLIGNATNTSNFLANGLNNVGSTIASISKQHYDAKQAYDKNQTEIGIALASSTNPNGAAQAVLTNPDAYNDANIQQIMNSVTNDSLKQSLQDILNKRNNNKTIS